MSEITLETSVTLRQAYLVMFEYLDRRWERTGKLDAVGDVLSNLALWNFESGIGQDFTKASDSAVKRPMDGAVFPDWLEAAGKVLSDEATPEGYRGADIQLK